MNPKVQILSLDIAIGKHRNSTFSWFVDFLESHLRLCCLQHEPQGSQLNPKWAWVIPIAPTMILGGCSCPQNDQWRNRTQEMTQRLFEITKSVASRFGGASGGFSFQQWPQHFSGFAKAMPFVLEAPSSFSFFTPKTHKRNHTIIHRNKYSGNAQTPWRLVLAAPPAPLGWLLDLKHRHRNCGNAHKLRVSFWKRLGEFTFQETTPNL